ncbi:MAG: hypothetical protein RMN52_02085 [Anaerolineae bacterium]|nr:hypothetical protein [Candidatus Roseilinea sp.]MDW8448770.1 hypothetical protein [Anaerolineae bacterium]
MKIGLDYVILIANNTYVTLANGWYSPIQALGVRSGQCRYYQNIRLTRKGKLLTHLTVTWTVGDAKNPPELLALISSPPHAHRRKFPR